ncbi:hypothetical protein [Haloarchaeobius sp. TZWSO28]|uniref:hypothetical protein n=1 Tax=Haloarchaeobius sp. TZWSO28 TaxID=3446119 RepID=UPI003EB90017
MNRRTLLKTLGAATLASHPALAQDNSTQTTTTQKPEPQQVVREVGSVDILDYDYSDGAFDIQMRTDSPVSTATISEQIGADRAGAGRFNIKQLNLTEGNVIETRVPAQMVDGKAVVTVTTSQSINDGYGIFLQAGNGFDLFNGPATWSLAATGSLGTFAGTAWGTKRYRESKLEEQEKRQIEEVK